MVTIITAQLVNTICIILTQNLIPSAVNQNLLHIWYNSTNWDPVMQIFLGFIHWCDQNTTVGWSLCCLFNPKCIYVPAVHLTNNVEYDITITWYWGNTGTSAYNAWVFCWNNIPSFNFFFLFQFKNHSIMIISELEWDRRIFLGSCPVLPSQLCSVGLLQSSWWLVLYSYVHELFTVIFASSRFIAAKSNLYLWFAVLS